MRTIGLLGGMSWQSSAEYYRLINEGVAERLGGLHSASVVMVSVDFATVEVLQREGRWDEAGELLAEHAVGLERAGAQLLALCTNTMHKVAPAIEDSIGVPLVHIVDATAKVVRGCGVRVVGLLGTRFTMEEPFYRERLTESGLEVIVPEDAERIMIDRVIFAELCRGILEEQSRREYLRVIESFRERGAEAVVLGCTEIPLLVNSRHTNMPLFDTTALHAQEVVRCALEE
jgi:aspartate racemase